MALSSTAPAVLNHAQLQAIHHVDGPCLVIAGAGSGKTRVITHKIARLLQSGLEPARIAAITFTNKAAQEMRDRAKALIGARPAALVTISTFHSLGVAMLREDGACLGLKPSFSILDSDDVLSLLRDAGATTDARLARQWQWAISLWKNQGLDSAKAAALASDEPQRVAARVMARYEERLRAYQAVDFDDLIGMPLLLLQSHADQRLKWQERYGHILIDECQDTNAVQYELLKALVSHPDPRRAARFTAVGDDDQSIYGWRGATIENLRRLAQDFPQLKVIALEQNYRSTGAILKAANNVIAANPKLFEKRLWSELGQGEPVALLECDSEEHEAERVVGRIQSLRANGGPHGKLMDFAILYRANHQSRAFEQKLRSAQIPYKVSGGQSFFDRAEIKDLCAWLRLLVNPEDDPAFLRAITTPKRGVGHQTLAKLGEFGAKWRTSLFEAIFSPALEATMPPKAMASLQEFGRQVNDLSFRAGQTTGAEAARALLMDWLQGIGYEQHLHDTEDNARLAAARWTHVLDFVDWVARRCGGEIDNLGGLTAQTPAQTVLQVAQTISVIISLAERGDEQDVVTLSTLHAAKGLEWPHVVLAGVNEGILPFSSEEEPPTADRLEEERRLMYVGVTRARQTLAVSTLRRRKRGRELVACRPSRFIAEMKLHETPAREDSRERLRRLRDELLADAAAGQPAKGRTTLP